MFARLEAWFDMLFSDPIGYFFRQVFSLRLIV